MSFSFTIPYITFLGLTLLIVIGITIFLIRRMNNQNQKFSSIVGVVTSLAEELNSIKSCISNSINNISNISTDTKIINTELIHVSDDDDEETDDEEETDDDDETDDEEETDEEEEEEQEEQVIVKEELSEDTDKNVKYIHLDNLQEDKHEIFGTLPEEIEETPLIQEETPLIQEETILIQEDPIEEIQSEELITDINIVKTEVTDYKKMSLTKLRTIISEKGLSDNISKLKKNECLQILETNLHN
jgi:cobalamin biosynthesis protein CobT